MAAVDFAVEHITHKPRILRHQAGRSINNPILGEVVVNPCLILLDISFAESFAEKRHSAADRRVTGVNSGIAVVHIGFHKRCSLHVIACDDHYFHAVSLCLVQYLTRPALDIVVILIKT